MRGHDRTEERTHRQHQAGSRGRVHRLTADRRSDGPPRGAASGRRMTTLQSMDVPPELRKRLVELRRSIHEEPELAFEEERTANKLESALRDAGITDVRRVARTAVIGRVRGSRKGAPTIALRGDIDALPITEETGLPFASRTAGVMHACGHDVHATWAVGAGALLAANPAVGDVLIVLQPAEETGRGAAAVLESGALDGTTAIFGGHVDRRFPVGQV